MKKIHLFILAIIFISCNYSTTQDSSENEEISEEEAKESYREISDLFLESDSEKISLISIIKDVPVEKVYSVLSDYKTETFPSNYGLSDSRNIIKIVDSIAQKNGLPKKLTASIIFSYEYEMITKDEIIEGYNDNIQDFQ